MSTRIRSITFDCHEPEILADFWSAALGFTKRETPAGFATWADYLESLGLPPGPWSTSAVVNDPTGAQARLLFLKVPEGKTVKNRVHLDLVPSGSMGEEVERLVALGATVQRVVDEQADVFTVMLDPEGNEFCVEREE